ncbi:hypothetical protein ACET3Z_014016 [Daucus carota]
MEESSTKKVACSNKDIISDLPQNVIEIILCFLPILDAVRTSVLSKKWRHCWTMIPDIVFDCDFSHYMLWDKLDQYKDKQLMAYKYVRIINKLLLLHSGPILSFSLNFLPMCDAGVIHDYVDQWIPLLLRKGMKRLTLEDHVQDYFTALHHFSSVELSHLRLANACLPYTPAFKGFTYLRKLELIDVYDLDDWILDCPVLEMLTLVICEGILHKNFNAPKLKYFHQLHRDLDSGYSLAGLENVAECALSLRLAEDLITETNTSNVVKAFSTLHKIETFSAGLCFIKYLAAGGSPNRLSKPLPYLKTLDISDIDFTLSSEVSCLLCLIRSAFNLCKLHISATHDAVKENLIEYWVEDPEDCTLEHLEVVTFSYFNGVQAELELVKFLLAHSPLLKTMFIHCSADIKRDVETTKAEEMWNYSTASSKAQIKYLNDPVHIDYFGDWVQEFDLGD